MRINGYCSWIILMHHKLSHSPTFPPLFFQPVSLRFYLKGACFRGLTNIPNWLSDLIWCKRIIISIISYPLCLTVSNHWVLLNGKSGASERCCIIIPWGVKKKKKTGEINNYVKIQYLEVYQPWSPHHQ